MLSVKFISTQNVKVRNWICAVVSDEIFAAEKDHFRDSKEDGISAPNSTANTTFILMRFKPRFPQQQRTAENCKYTAAKTVNEPQWPQLKRKCFDDLPQDNGSLPPQDKNIRSNAENCSLNRLWCETGTSFPSGREKGCEVGNNSFRIILRASLPHSRNTTAIAACLRWPSGGEKVQRLRRSVAGGDLHRRRLNAFSRARG